MWQRCGGRRQAAIALGSLLTCFQLCHNCSSLVRFRLSEEIVDLEKYMKNGLARTLDPASSRFYNKEKMSRRNPISPRLSEMVIRSGNTILSSSAASPSYSHQQETKGAEASNRKRRDRISLAFQNTWPKHPNKNKTKKTSNNDNNKQNNHDDDNNDDDNGVALVRVYIWPWWRTYFQKKDVWPATFTIYKQANWQKGSTSFAVLWHSSNHWTVT